MLQILEGPNKTVMISNLTFKQYVLILRALYEYRQDKGFEYYKDLEELENELWNPHRLTNSVLNSRPSDL